MLFRKRYKHFKYTKRFTFKPGTSVRERKRKIFFRWFKRFVTYVTIIIIAGTIVFVIFMTMLSVVVSLKTGHKVNYLSIVTSKFVQLPMIENIYKHLSKDKDINDKQHWIIGLEDVPVFPGSVFVFDDIVTDLNNPDFLDNPPKDFNKQEMLELYKFLTDNNSVYLMPLNSSWNDVVNFYKVTLPQYGWQHVLSVDVDDLSKIKGEYFVKGDKGLHIYTIKYDIWYELITKEQAENGLQDLVYNYRKQKMKIQSKLGVSLPNGVFWELKYSPDWTLSLLKTDMKVPGLKFIHNKDTLIIMPLEYLKKPLAELEYKDLENQSTRLLSTNPLFVDLDKKDIQSIQVIKFEPQGVKAIKYIEAKKQIYIAFIPNSKNTILYAFYYKGDDPTFFEYVISEIKAK